MATVTELDMFIGGAWRPSATGETSSALSPATGETIGSVALGDRDDARAAIAGARAAVQAIAALRAGSLEVAPLQSYL